jgi:HEPN domain-containing protein
MIDKVKYWVELSDYDLITAEAMLTTSRYLYVGFMCHQTIEKILKAFFTKHHETTPPYTHSLSYLAEKSGILEELTEQRLKFINSVEPMNIEARYPSRKQELFKSLSKHKCQEIVKQTKEFQQWVKTKL